MRYKAIAFQLLAILGATGQGISFAADAPAVVNRVREFPISAEPGWPAGVLAILNDITRIEKLENNRQFHFNSPDAVSWYGLAIRNMDDVNRLVRYLSVVKADPPELYLQPEKGWSPGHGEGAFISFGNQKTLDEWYHRLPEVEPGVSESGTIRNREPPTAEVRLGLYIGHPAVDLAKLEVPLNVEITTATAVAYRDEHPSEFKKIDALIERHKADQEQLSAHAKWLAAALTEIQSIQSGMTRADLLKAFAEEEGTLRDQRKYAYRSCRLIKIVVDFEPANDAPNRRESNDWSQDRITTVSKPFLEAPIRE